MVHAGEIKTLQQYFPHNLSWNDKMWSNFSYIPKTFRVYIVTRYHRRRSMALGETIRAAPRMRAVRSWSSRTTLTVSDGSASIKRGSHVSGRRVLRPDVPMEIGILALRRLNNCQEPSDTTIETSFKYRYRQ